MNSASFIFDFCTAIHTAVFNEICSIIVKNKVNNGKMPLYMVICAFSSLYYALKDAAFYDILCIALLNRSYHIGKIHLPSRALLRGLLNMRNAIKQRRYIFEA